MPVCNRHRSWASTSWRVHHVWRWRKRKTTRRI